MQISKYLNLDTLTRSTKAKKYKISNLPNAEQTENLKNICTQIYDKLHEYFKGNLIISSGFRSEKVNTLVGGAKNSSHMKGEALDIEGTNGVSNKEIFEYVQKNFTFDQLIWEFGNVNNPAWVHVSLAKTTNRNSVFSIGLKKIF